MVKNSLINDNFFIIHVLTRKIKLVWWVEGVLDKHGLPV